MAFHQRSHPNIGGAWLIQGLSCLMSSHVSYHSGQYEDCSQPCVWRWGTGVGALTFSLILVPLSLVNRCLVVDLFKLTLQGFQHLRQSRGNVSYTLASVHGCFARSKLQIYGLENLRRGTFVVVPFLSGTPNFFDYIGQTFYYFRRRGLAEMFQVLTIHWKDVYARR